MQLLSLLAVAGLATSVVGRSTRYSGKSKLEDVRPRHGYPAQNEQAKYSKRSAEPLVKRSNATDKFIVNGTGIPYVDFDIGESYAGLLPISDAANETSELYFWYFPTSNPESDEITIWLNGGPGCSSLEGFFQENGPVIWQYGTYKPVYNPWTWVNLTNMVWVEQPVGTGFTQGTPTAQSTAEAAQQFAGFWKNFVKTFGYEGKKVYIAGESYAGMYVPYFADAFLEKNDTTYYDVQGIMIYDPSINTDDVLEEVPAVPFVDHWAHLFNLNDSYLDTLHDANSKCGYDTYLDTYLTYPPTGPIPQPPSCDEDLWTDIYNAVLYTNPCFDIYAIATTCPLLWDVLGFPGSIGYQPDGAFIYFNLTSVQDAINAPHEEWAECSDGVLSQDSSPPSSFEVLPSVIDKLQRTVIVHGDLDFILLANGTLLTIQNMTWGGEQGFQSPPTEDFFVPYHDEVSLGTISASGIMGVAHTERKLTFVGQSLSGHMVPQYQPSSAYRQLEFLLGRIDSLSQEGSFTTRPNGTNATTYGASAKRKLGSMRGSMPVGGVENWV